MKHIHNLVVLALVCLLAGCAAAGPRAQGIQVRFIIYSISTAPDGSRVTESYENAVLVASGESFERKVGPRYRISLMAHVEGASVRVRFAAFDLMRNTKAGATTTLVAVDGQSEATLDASSDHRYRVVLKVTKRDLPTPAV
jgi:hypothetical protein